MNRGFVWSGNRRSSSTRGSKGRRAPRGRTSPVPSLAVVALTLPPPARGSGLVWSQSPPRLRGPPPAAGLVPPLRYPLPPAGVPRPRPFPPAWRVGASGGPRMCAWTIPGCLRSSWASVCVGCWGWGGWAGVGVAGWGCLCGGVAVGACCVLAGVLMFNLLAVHTCPLCYKGTCFNMAPSRAFSVLCKGARFYTAPSRAFTLAPSRAFPSL